MPDVPKAIRRPWENATPTAKRRAANQPSDVRYHSTAWRDLRTEVLRKYPFCPLCQAELKRVVATTVADHIVPAKLNLVDFYDKNNLWGLCKTHHESKSAMEGRCNDVGRTPVEALIALSRAAAAHMPLLRAMLSRAVLWTTEGKPWPAPLTKFLNSNG